MQKQRLEPAEASRKSSTWLSGWPEATRGGSPSPHHLGQGTQNMQVSHCMRMSSSVSPREKTLETWCTGEEADGK